MDNDKFAVVLAVEEEGLLRLLGAASRLDERVALVVARAHDQEQKVLEVLNSTTKLTTRVVVLEARDREELRRMHDANVTRVKELERRVEKLEEARAGGDVRVRKIAERAGEILLAIASAYLIWRLGWASH